MRSKIKYFLLLLLFSCNSIEPPPQNNASLSLALEDVSCIEAWIKLTTNSQIPVTINLKQTDEAGIEKQTIINLSTADTVLYIDSLLPSNTYKFQSFVQSINQSELKSNELSITTMDTTSHQILWEEFIIGEPGSIANDVAIINENDIWVVGTFFKNGSDTTYNAAVWNGANWQIIYIPNKGFGGFFSYAPLRAIFYVDTELWVIGESGGYSRFRNGQWETEYISQAQGAKYKIWGTSSDNLFFVGSNGSITKFDGVDFSLMNSNTDIMLTDIYGTPSGSEIWTCGWNNSDGRSIILRLNESNWDIIWERNMNPNNLPYSGFVSTLWTSGKTEFLLTGIPDGIVRHSITTLDFAREDNFAIEYFSYRMRGDEKNNIFLAGDDSSIWHFNGASWNRFDNLLNNFDRLRSLDVKDGVAVATGFRFTGLLTGALIIKGRR